jgi:hypothetical protein
MSPRLNCCFAAIALTAAFAHIPTVSAQMTDSACAASLAALGDLDLKLEKQINDDLAKSPKDFDVAIYHAHQDQFSELVDAGRKHLSNCANWDSTRNQAMVLGAIASGLVYLWQPDDAIPIFKRCVGLERENMSCLSGLAEAYQMVCRFDEARATYGKVVDIGGFTEMNAKWVELAKTALSTMKSPTYEKSMRSLYHCDSKQAEENQNPNR